MGSRKKNPLFGQEAVAVARAAVADLGEGAPGRHVRVVPSSGNTATHQFASDVPGYPNWEWHVVLACATGSTDVTVNEVALVPGKRSLQAPEWVPYSKRVRPGDLRPGDLLPPSPDDERLSDEGTLTQRAIEEAKKRWRSGEHGPTSAMAAAAALQCRTCAFLLPMESALGENFGVCCNKYSADAAVVHAAYGCGAHSRTRVKEEGSAAPEAYDDEQPL